MKKLSRPKRIFALAAALSAALIFCLPLARAGAPEDFERGEKALLEGDYIAAKVGFDAALSQDPSLSRKIAPLWHAAARKSARSNDVLGAAGLWASAVALDSTLGEAAGNELLAAADSIADADERARAVHVAAPWVGAQNAARATAKWRAKVWGDPIEVSLQSEGWAVFGEVGPGDRLAYVAPDFIAQRNGEMMRILPEAIDKPFELTFDTPRAPLKLRRKDTPLTAYIWIFPAR